MSFAVPALIDSTSGLRRYLQEIKRFPLLSAEEEYVLAKRYQEHKDTNAAHRLVTSHLRLVARIAMGYRGYGLPISDIISEGNVGLMQSVKKFDPDRGFRLSTYAMWWIKAAIQEYVLRSWSLVKIGTTTAQKKLFFNLRRLKSQIQGANSGHLQPEEVTEIAERLDVSEADVESMSQRMGGNDHSLNALVSRDADGEQEWMDWLEDDRPNPEVQVVERDQHDKRMELLTTAMQGLTERERHIIEARRLRDEPQTLEDLSQTYNISRERIRQIETRAMEKLETGMRKMAGA
jgi:RNA polymerase sigma-32 factor